MLVLDMMLPILPLPLREGMYMQLMVPLIMMVLLNSMGQSSLQMYIHPLIIITRSTKPNMANNHLHPYLGFRRIITESQPLLLLRNMPVLFMFLLKCINASVLRLLLPLRNIILRPSTSLPRKEGFM